MFQIQNKFLIWGGIGFLMLFSTQIYLNYTHDHSNIKTTGERENILLGTLLSSLLSEEIEQYANLRHQKREMLMQSDLYRKVQTRIMQYSKKYPILKIKIFNIGGMTVFSTNVSEIGVDKQNNYSINAANQGIITSELELKKTFLSIKDELSNRYIVETYLPIYSESNEIIAIFELYSDVTEAYNTSIQELSNFLLILIIINSTLFLSLFVLARKADGVIVNQYQSLASTNTDLENRVEERTQSLRIALANAEESTKAKSRFLANMSHELRTPMHAILSFSNLGLKHVEESKLESYFTRIRTSGQRLTSLLDDLLDLSKLEAGKMQIEYSQVDIAALAQETVDEVSSLISEKSISVEVQVDEPITATIDKKLIHQVMTNLLSNAIKFSPENSRIEIAITKNDANRLKVSVIDEGVGIPVNEIKSIFSTFVQSSKTRSNAGGTGLGLPISKEIIKLHNGKIWTESPPIGKGEGSVFIFEIPIIQNKADIQLN